MSAFGYGASSNSSWRANAAPGNPSLDPIFSRAPAMTMPNFNPSTTSAWSNPTAMDVGDWSVGEKSAFGDTYNANGDYWYRDPWANPLQSLFGTLNGQNQAATSPQVQFGQYGTGDGYTPIYGYIGEQDRRNDPNNPSPGGPRRGIPDQYQIGRIYTPQGYNTPSNAKELYGSVGNLSMGQLMGLSSGSGSLADKFSQVSQDYTNAYANPNYGKRIFGQNDQVYGKNDLSQSETTDWLQKSYGALLGRLDNNYLL